MRLQITAFAILLAAGMSIPALADDAQSDHHIVRISGLDVHPMKLEVGAGEPVGWMNHSRFKVIVVFPPGTEKKFTCDIAGLKFYLDEKGNVTSTPIGQWELITPCGLAAGQYDYRIELYRDLGSGAKHPDADLRASIVAK
jgi:hypothetical protein